MSRSEVIAYEFGPFRLDMQKYRLLRKNKSIQLSPKAFRTLLALVQNRDRIAKKEELINTIWPDAYVEESNLAQNVFVLRKALGDEKSEHKFIVTIPGIGYRFVAPVTEIREPDSAASLPVAQRHPQLEEGIGTSIAVLPFKSLGDEEVNELMVLGLADALVARLSNLSQIRVRPTLSGFQYREAKPDYLLIGRELNVDSLLHGTLQRVGDQMRASVQLIRVKDGTNLWAAKFDSSFTDVFSVQDVIADQVARALAAKLGGEAEHESKKNYMHGDAFLAFVRGRYFWNQRNASSLRRGLSYAQQAIATDPAYAPGYAAIADSYNLLAGHGGLAPADTFPKAKAAAMCALELDEKLAEAYASLAFVNYRFEWNWSVAEQNFRRSIDLKPTYATAYHWYGEYLAAMGRFDESLAALERARELDPLSLPVNTDLAQTLYFAGRYVQCEKEVQKTLEMDRRFVRAHIIHGSGLEQEQRYKEAVAAFEEAVELSEKDSLAMSSLGHVYAQMGNKEKAREVLAFLEHWSTQRYVSGYNIAVILAGLKEHEKALMLLQRAIEERDVWLVWLNLDPRFSDLSKEPGFGKLLRSVGLP